MTSEKMQFLRRVRREYIDQITWHPYYGRFLEFLAEHEDEAHYPRFALTIAHLLNAIPEQFPAKSGTLFCETGGLSLLSKFFQMEGANVSDTKSDLRYYIEHGSDQFDFVMSLEVIEHIKDQAERSFPEVTNFNGSGVRQYASEMQRILKPGGYLVLTTPNPCSLRALELIAANEPPSIFRPHVREYTKGELLDLFRGLELISYHALYAYWYIDIGERVMGELATKTGWSAEDRGDCHFFVFRKPI